MAQLHMRLHQQVQACVQKCNVDVVKRQTLQSMNDETFDRLYFKAALGGTKKIGEFMIDLVNARHVRYAYRLIRMHSPGATEAPTIDNISKDRPCDWSPFGYCFTTGLGPTTEHHIEDSLYCIWCERIWAPPNTVDFKIDMTDALRYGELHRNEN